MEDELGRTVLIVSLCLFFSVLRVIPNVNFSVFRSAHDDLLVRRVPIEASDFLFMEV